MKKYAVFLVHLVFLAANVTALDAQYLGSFSPNGDGIKDTISLNMGTSVEDKSAPVKINIFFMGDEQIENLIGSFVVEPSLSSIWEFDGVLPDGTAISEGRYRLKVFLIEESATIGSDPVVTAEFTVDITSPVALLAVGEKAIDPNNRHVVDTLVIEQTSSSEELWIASIQSDSGQMVWEKTWNGFIDDVEWNGLDLQGQPVSGGFYTYTLQCQDDAGNISVYTIDNIKVLTGRFGSSGSNQTGSIAVTLEGEPFTPDGDGKNDLLSVFLEYQGITEPAEWSLKMTGKELLTGTGGLPGRLRWEGLLPDGNSVTSGQEYILDFEVADATGIRIFTSFTVETGILTMINGKNRLVRIAPVQFAPFAWDAFEGEESLVAVNRESIKEITRLMKKFPNVRIQITGHGNSLLYEDPSKVSREQREVLIPLTKKRAESVAQELVKAGIDAGRIEIEAMGGLSPVVPFPDREKRWVNRRVEFILLDH